MPHTTSEDLTPDAARWASWIDELLRRLGWSNTQLAQAIGVSVGTVGTWRSGKFIASPAQIRAIVEVPEVSELVTAIDAFLAAGVLWESDLRSRQKQKTRTPLYEYSLAELNHELHERVKRIAADLDSSASDPK